VLLDGVGHYTTARVRAGETLWVDRHVARLSVDARRLGLPAVDERVVRTAFAELAAAAFGPGDGAIRLQHSRDASGHSRWLGIARGLGDEPESWRAIRAPLCHEGTRPWSGAKTTHTLAYAIARDAATARGAQEALFADHAGRLIEGARCNLFAVLEDGSWATPDLARGGVAGLARDVVLEGTARFAVRDIAFHALPRAREIVAVNSLRGGRAVIELDGTPIGSASGPALDLVNELLALR
jgi:branched-subunit amino acid aminotransferase/4-amino-4-deoxychorismate lyase